MRTQDRYLREVHEYWIFKGSIKTTKSAVKCQTTLLQFLFARLCCHWNYFNWIFREGLDSIVIPSNIKTFCFNESFLNILNDSVFHLISHTDKLYLYALLEWKDVFTSSWKIVCFIENSDQLNWCLLCAMDASYEARESSKLTSHY